MHSVTFFGVDTYLGDCDCSGEECMVGEEDIVEIDFASLLVVDEVAVCVVDAVEQEAGEIHGDEIKVHALYTKDIFIVTS
jgi:hypothetical protein